MKKTKFLRKRTLTLLLILKVLLVSGYPSSSADSEQSEGENKIYFSQTNRNCGHIMICSIVRTVWDTRHTSPMLTNAIQQYSNSV